MRHLRLNNHNNSSLSAFKTQIASLIQSITNFNADDRKEAINYVQQLINDCSLLKDERNVSDTLEDVTHEVATVITRQKTKRKIKLPIKKRKSSVIKKLPCKIITKQKLKVLKCKVCNEIKKTKISLLKHMEFHVGTPISCTSCRQTFNSRLSFDFHLTHLCKKRKTSINKRFKCPECPQIFSLQRHLDLHIEGHKRNNCSYCDAVLTRRQHLIQHMLEIHKIKLERSMFCCSYCEKRFVKRQSLYYHLRQHVPEKFICLDCGTIIDTSEEYNEHIKRHDEQKPWQCSQCKDRFSRRQQYLFHLKRHDRYKCLTCKENYASKVHAYKHYKRGHLVQGLEPQMRCPYCPAAFHRTLLLQMHIKKHKEDTSTINCKFCDKTFHTPYQYYKHCKTTVHDKNSPELSQLVCENCGKQFTKKYMLEQHLKRFHGKKPAKVSCKYCDYQTYFKPNLERHINLHFSDKKQYMCDHCGKTFSNIGGLTDHIDYIHVQEKQFKCGECSKSFKRNSELVRHQSCHSDARPHVCGLCGQAYKRVNHLRRHEKNTHELNIKNKKVQRLKTDKTGAVIPIPVEPKKPVKNVKVSRKEEINDQVYSLYVSDEQMEEYYGTTVSVINSVSLPKTMNGGNLITMDADGFTQQEFWANKLDLSLEKNNGVTYTTSSSDLVQNNEIIYNTTSANLAHMSSLNPHENDLQTFNVMDQLVKSLLPSKDLQIIDCQEFNDYTTNIPLDYNNVDDSTVNRENPILAANQKIGVNDVSW